jgi:ATP-dependent Clp protease ATP-binding subunit ClpA
VIDYSCQAAETFNANYVGTEHLLLGLLQEEEGVAARVLTHLGVTLDTAREEIRRVLGYDVSGEEAAESAFGKPSIALENIPADALRMLKSHDEKFARLDDAKLQAIERRDFDEAARQRDATERLKKELLKRLGDLSEDQ